MDIGTEEIAHVEMLATMITRLLETSPVEAQEDASKNSIMAGFMAAKYFMPLIFICQFLGGITLLSGFFVNAGLVFLGPIIVNIVGIHLAVEPTGLPMAIVVLVLYLIVLASRWSDFKQLLKR